MTFTEVVITQEHRGLFGEHAKTIFVKAGYPHPPEYEVVFVSEHHHDRKIVAKDRHHDKWIYVHMKKHLLHAHYDIEEVKIVTHHEGWRAFI